MKRRDAIQSITLLSSSIFLFQSCDFESFVVYENIPLERNQRILLNQFLASLLPNKEGVKIITPESTPDYLLTIINDCFSREDITKYITGFAEFQTYLENNFKKSFKDLEDDQKLELLQYCSESENRLDELQFFYKTSKSLAVQHFTTSEYYMVNFLDFEFIPGRYLGCVSV